MKNKSRILLVLLGGLLFSCGEHKVVDGDERILNEDSLITTINEHSGESIIDLQNRVFKDGDVTSYLVLRDIYLDLPPEDFLFWPFIMANKHGYAEAHLDVFYSFLDSYVGGDLGSFHEIDDVTKDLMLNYLNKAIGLGVKDANNILYEINGK